MIHILQQLCPQRHCYVAAAWDDLTGTEAEAAYMLGKMATAISQGKPPVCAICGAVDWRLEDGVTRFATLAEAAPHLKACELAQLITRELLTRTTDRN